MGDGIGALCREAFLKAREMGWPCIRAPANLVLDPVGEQLQPLLEKQALPPAGHLPQRGLRRFHAQYGRVKQPVAPKNGYDQDTHEHHVRSGTSKGERVARGGATKAFPSGELRQAARRRLVRESWEAGGGGRAVLEEFAPTQGGGERDATGRARNGDVPEYTSAQGQQIFFKARAKKARGALTMRCVQEVVDLKPLQII